MEEILTSEKKTHISEYSVINSHIRNCFSTTKILNSNFPSSPELNFHDFFSTHPSLLRMQIFPLFLKLFPKRECKMDGGNVFSTLPY